MANSRQKILSFFLLFWICFVYIWLIWGWKDTAELFSATWWFDEAGHTLYGFMGSVTLLYLSQNYVAEGFSRIAKRWERFLYYIVIIAVISLGGVFWEFVEVFWDVWWQPEYFDWLAKAQSDSVDTSVDIMANTVFAAIPILIYALYNALYNTMYPAETEKLLIEEIRCRIRELSKEIADRRREHRKDIIPDIRAELRELFHAIFPKIKNKPL